MANDVKQFCLNCRVCNPTRVVDENHEVAPYTVWDINILGPFRRTTRGNIFIILFTCPITKKINIYATTNNQASTIARIITDEILPQYGFPKQLQMSANEQEVSRTSQETMFRLNLLHDICTLLKMDQARGNLSLITPEGHLEKVKRTVQAGLEALMKEDVENWDLWIQPFVTVCREIIQSNVEISTKGNDNTIIDLPSQPTINNEDTDTQQLIQKCKTTLRQLTRVSQLKRNDRTKVDYDRWIAGTPFSEGDLVKITHEVTIPTTYKRKFRHQTLGPYIVVGRPAKTRYYLMDPLDPEGPVIAAEFYRLAIYRVDPATDPRREIPQYRHLTEIQIKEVDSWDNSFSIYSELSSNEATSGSTDDIPIHQVQLAVVPDQRATEVILQQSHQGSEMTSEAMETDQICPADNLDTTHESLPSMTEDSMLSLNMEGETQVKGKNENNQAPQWQLPSQDVRINSVNHQTRDTRQYPPTPSRSPSLKRKIKSPTTNRQPQRGTTDMNNNQNWEQNRQPEYYTLMPGEESDRQTSVNSKHYRREILQSVDVKGNQQGGVMQQQMVYQTQPEDLRGHGVAVNRIQSQENSGYYSEEMEQEPGTQGQNIQRNPEIKNEQRWNRTRQLTTYELEELRAGRVPTTYSPEIRGYYETPGLVVRNGNGQHLDLVSQHVFPKSSPTRSYETNPLVVQRENVPPITSVTSRTPSTNPTYPRGILIKPQQVPDQQKNSAPQRNIYFNNDVHVRPIEKIGRSAAEREAIRRGIINQTPIVSPLVLTTQESRQEIVEVMSDTMQPMVEENQRKTLQSAYRPYTFATAEEFNRHPQAMYNNQPVRPGPIRPLEDDYSTDSDQTSKNLRQARENCCRNALKNRYQQKTADGCDYVPRTVPERDPNNGRITVLPRERRVTQNDGIPKSPKNHRPRKNSKSAKSPGNTRNVTPSETRN
jgi:hypothetical protein